MNTYCAIVRLRREGLGSARTHTVTVVLDAVSPDEAIVHAEALALATIKTLPLLWRVEESWLTDELVDARVTAELENARAQAMADRAFQTDDTALRARVAELEKAREDDAVRMKREAVQWMDGWCQRNAELVAALRPLAMVAKYCGRINDSTGVWSHTSIIDSEHFSLTIGDCRRASATLARAESTTPAKHPDTEIVDWLDAQFQGGDDWCRLFPLGNTIREAYAARKQGSKS